MCSCLKQKLFDLEYNKFNTFDMSNCTFNNFLTEVYSPTVEKENIILLFLQEKILKLLEKFAILLYLILMILMIRIYFLLEILV